MASDAHLITDKERLRPETSEVLRLCCDNSKLKKYTGFSPQYTLNEGLEKTINWFVNPINLSKYKADIYNV